MLEIGQNRAHKVLTRWTCWSLEPRSKFRCFLPCWICVFGFLWKTDNLNFSRSFYADFTIGFRHFSDSISCLHLSSAINLVPKPRILVWLNLVWWCNSPRQVKNLPRKFGIVKARIKSVLLTRFLSFCKETETKSKNGRKQRNLLRGPRDQHVHRVSTLWARFWPISSI